MNREEEKDRAETPPEEGAEASSETTAEVAEDESEEVAPDSELAEALREKDQFRSMMQRAQADLVNYRNRVESEKEELRERTKRLMLTKTLDIVDAIDSALTDEAKAGVDQKFVEGVEGIRRSFESFLASEGVERFDSAGEKFDPRKHEALVRTETGEHDPDTIINVMRVGYSIKEDILRPALVEVAAAPQTEEK